MKISAVREIARKRRMTKIGKMIKTDLIRAIQRDEGNGDCYATPYARDCNQINCLWREDCLKENELSRLVASR